MSGPLSHEEAQRRLEQLAEDERRQAEADFRALLSTPPGRRWFWRLVDGRAGVTSASYSGEQSHRAAYLEGRRSLGVELMSEAQRIAPADFLHMLAEAYQSRQEAALHRASAEAAAEDDDG